MAAKTTEQARCVSPSQVGIAEDLDISMPPRSRLNGSVPQSDLLITAIHRPGETKNTNFCYITTDPSAYIAEGGGLNAPAPGLEGDTPINRDRALQEVLREISAQNPHIQRSADARTLGPVNAPQQVSNYRAQGLAR